MWHLNITQNYKDDTEEHELLIANSTIELLRQINIALQSVTATSFVFTVVKKAETGN